MKLPDPTIMRPLPRLRHPAFLAPPPSCPVAAPVLPPGVAPITAEDVVRRALEIAKWRDHPGRARFEPFLEEVGRTDEGHRISLFPYIRVLGECLRACRAAGRHFSHVAPPGVGKSTITRQFMLWLLGRDPRERCVVTSGEESTAIRSVALLRDIILNTSFLRIFPEVVPDISRSRDGRGWRQSQFFFRVPDVQTPDAAMEAVALMTRGESRRTDILLVDDAVTRQIAESDALLGNAISAFEKTWLDGRLAHGGWCVSLQNCWTDADLAHRLTRDERFCSLWVGVEEECDALFVRIRNAPGGLRLNDAPEEFEAERVAPSPLPKVRGFEDFGSKTWDAEFRIPLPPLPQWTPEALRTAQRTAGVTHRQLRRLIAAKPGDLMFPSWDQRERPQATIAQLLGLETRAGKIMMNDMDRARLAVSAGFDLSGLTRHGAAIWFVAKDIRGRKYPLEAYRGAFTVQHIIAIFEDAWQRGIRPGIIYGENNGIQELIVEAIRTLRKEHGAAYDWQGKVCGFTTGRNKSDPTIGLPGMEVELSNRIIIWPGLESTREGSPCAAAWRVTEEEMATLPRMIQRGKTPDGPMGFWFAWSGLDRVAVGPPSAAERPSTVRYESWNSDGFRGSFL